MRLIVTWAIGLLLLGGCATIGKQSYLTANTQKEQQLMDEETEIKFGNYIDAEIQNSS